MLKTRRIVFLCVIVFVCVVFTTITQNVPAASGRAGRAGLSDANSTAVATGRSVGTGRGTMTRGGLGTQAADPRVQSRTYVLADTNETLPYSLFVSSKVSKEKKAPLIVMLHGLGVDNSFMIRGNVLDLAETGGYIVVAPIGYNSGGWYGISSMAQMMGGGMGRGAPATTPQPQPGTGARATQPGTRTGRGLQSAGRGFSFGSTTGGSVVTDPAKVAELSEKDVMNVLEIIRKEFNIDEKRTYLMGHSMGGAGTLYLGVKYAKNWAAIGAIAPAAFTLQPNSLEKVKDMPVIIVQGDADTLVPVTNTRQWVDKLKELKMTYEYKEIPGGDHGSVITAGMPEIFKFFGEHSKKDPNSSPDSATSRTIP